MTVRTEAGKRLAAVPLIDGDDAPLDLTEDLAAIESEARAAALREVAERLGVLPILKISGEAMSETLAGLPGVAGAEAFFVDWDEQEWFVALSAVQGLTEATDTSATRAVGASE